MEIFAHRGLVNKCPENSLMALSMALESGFSIETDIRLTRDNDFIVIHDDNYRRLTGYNIAVRDLTLGEATQLKYLKSDNSLISFRLLLEEFTRKERQNMMAVHLKADSQTSIGLQLLAQYWQEFNLNHRAFVYDLTKEAAEYLKQIESRIQIALIVSDYPFEPTIYLWSQVKNLKAMDIVWAAEYRMLYGSEFISVVKKTRRKIYVVSPELHTILNHPLAARGYENIWRNLQRWGVDGICTDHPRKLRKYLQGTIF